MSACGTIQNASKLVQVKDCSAGIQYSNPNRHKSHVGSIQSSRRQNLLALETFKFMEETKERARRWVRREKRVNKKEDCGFILSVFKFFPCSLSRGEVHRCTFIHPNHTFFIRKRENSNYFSQGWMPPMAEIVGYPQKPILSLSCMEFSLGRDTLFRSLNMGLPSEKVLTYQVQMPGDEIHGRDWIMRLTTSLIA